VTIDPVSERVDTSCCIGNRHIPQDLAGGVNSCSTQRISMGVDTNRDWLLNRFHNALPF